MNTSPDFNLQVAIHEAAHFVAAGHYQIPARPELTPGGVSTLVPEISSEGNAGVCHMAPPFTKYQFAVVCWSGILAECLLGVAPSWAPPFPPSARNLQDWHLMVLNQADKLSWADKLGIFGACDTGDSKRFTPGGVWRSCKSAFRILRGNRARILRLAKSLNEAKAKSDREADERKWADIPRPSAFPATHEDFVRLVSGNDAELFERFIAYKAKSHLTNGRPENFEDAKKSLLNHFLGLVTDELRAQHAGNTDAKISDLQFDAEYASAVDLQRTSYAGDFKNETTWLAAARDFQQWAADKK